MAMGKTIFEASGFLKFTCNLIVEVFMNKQFKDFFKNFIKLFYFRFFLFFPYFIKIFLRFNSTKRNKNCFIIAPTDVGSYGDAAMVGVVAKECITLGLSPIVICQKNSWKEALTLLDLDVPCVEVRHLYSAPLGWLHFIKAVIRYRPSHVMCIGADVLDGFYSKWRSLSRISYVDLLSEYSDDARILGFSYKENADKDCTRYLSYVTHNGVKAFARDSDSCSRMINNNIAVEQSMDLAFLLNSQNYNLPFSGDFACLNLCLVHYNLYGDEFVGKVKIFFANVISSSNLNFVFVPHDDRCNEKGVSDLVLLKEVYESLSPEQKKRCHVVSDLLTVSQVRCIAGRAKFCIVGRKHMGVGALGECTPTMFFEYQGKQKGLLKIAGLDSELNLLTPESKVSVWNAQFTKFEKDCTAQEMILKNAMPDILKMAKINFEGLDSLK
jgi:polysaccharide pyruvyl transferase WcaK-like protein